VASPLFERAVALARRAPGIDEYVITGRQRRRVGRRAGAPRAEDTEDIAVALFRDLPSGRAGVSLRVTQRDLPRLPDLLASAARDAATAVGPSWRLPPPAAPARVPLDDSRVAGNPAAALAALDEQLRDAGVQPGDQDVAAEVTTAAIATSGGLRTSFSATVIDVRATVRDRGARSAVQLRRRRFDQMDLPGQAARARARCQIRAAATSAPAGTYDLVVGADALGHPGTGWGLLGPLAAQAADNAANRGTARYLPGQIALAGDGDPITVWSDGALPFGLLSRPFGELGEAVRRFALIEDNRAADVGRTARLAGVAGGLVNGGVRNLVLTPGQRSGDELLAPGDVPVLEVQAWSWLRTDAAAGSFLGEVEAGLVHRVGQPPQPVASNLVSGDAFAAWSNALLGEQSTFLGWYSGPSTIKFRGIQVAA